MEFYTSVIRKGNQILYRGMSGSQEIFKSIYYEPALYMRCPKHKATHEDFYGGPVVEQRFGSAAEMNDFVKRYKDIPDEIWGNKNIVSQFIYEKFGSTINYDGKKLRGAFIDIEVMTRERVGDTWIDGGFPIADEARFPVNAICHYDTETKRYYEFSLAAWKEEKSCYPELAKKSTYYYFDSERSLLLNWIQFVKNKYPHYITGWNIEKFDIPYLVNRIKFVLGDTYVKKLSPWNTVESHTVNTMYGEEVTYDIYGITILDYLELYKKHIFVPRESYRLDFIAECELGEHKKEFEGTHGSFFWDDPQGFVDYNIKDVNLVVRLDDKLQLINLVVSLAYFAGINYVETFSPIRTWDTLVYRECMNRHIAIPLNDMKSEREEYEGAYVFPTKNGMYKSIASFDVASMYPNCNRSWNIGSDVIVDNEQYTVILKHIISECVKNKNIELAQLAKQGSSFVEYYKNNGMPSYVTDVLKHYGVSLTPNWQFFRTDKESIFTKLQSDLYFGRKADKKKGQEYAQKEKELHIMLNSDPNNQELLKQYEEAKHYKVVYNTSQQVKKILLNSYYGATGSPYFRYYDKRLAQATTLSGQNLIRKTAKNISTFIGNIVGDANNVENKYIAAGDTDSCYVNTYPIYDCFVLKKGKTMNEQERTDFYDSVCKTIEENVINVTLKELGTSLNTYQNTLAMDREVICAGSDETGYCGFWVAKKRYALRVNDNEGLRYETPKLKVMGLAQVQSSTPKICRDNLTEATRTMIEQGPDAVRDYVKDVEKKFMEKTVEEIALPRSVSNVEKYSDNGRPIKGTPVQSKAAINHNFLVKKLALENFVQFIRDGEKLKFLYLTPNQFGFDVIGFRDKLPKEFGLHARVDKESHFDKAFKKPLSDMMEACGWQMVETATLDDFF